MNLSVEAGTHNAVPLLSETQIRASQTIQHCYQQLLKQQTNLVLEVLRDQDTIYQWHHYPKGDVKNSTSQFYYHSHERSENSEESIHEHGHFHCFIRKPGTYTTESPIVVSKKHLADAKKDNLCHLVAIGINKTAQPTALFTLNHWVVGGLWYSAEETCELLDHFDLRDDTSQPIVSPWVTAMIQLFKPQIKELLHHRDRVIAEWQTEGGDGVFQDRKLEVTSIFSFN